MNALGEYWVRCENNHASAMSPTKIQAIESWNQRPKTVEKVIFRGYAVKWASGCVETFRNKRIAQAVNGKSWSGESTIHRVRVVEIKPKKRAKK